MLNMPNVIVILSYNIPTLMKSLLKIYKRSYTKNILSFKPFKHLKLSMLLSPFKRCVIKLASRHPSA